MKSSSSTIQTLLNNEFRVRGTVRSRGKGEYLQQLYDSDNFEYIIVEDIADVSLIYVEPSFAENISLMLW